MKKNSYICFVAGKSGGHLLPCITKAQQIIAQQPETKILFFTTKGTLDKTIVEQYPCLTNVVFLPIKPFPNKRFWRYPAFIWHLITSFYISLCMLSRLKPRSIISMGGLISLPVCLAGKLLMLPIILYELNVIPGKAIKALAPFATSIFICFEKTQTYFKKKCTFTHYPIRFSEHHKLLSKEYACKKINFQAHIPILLILGGSQGSLFLNNVIKSWIQRVNPQSIQIIHQIGNNDTTTWQSFYKSVNIHAIVFSFHHDIEHYYAAADIILCRAGAGTLFEVLFFKKQCIVIPLETNTNNHQLSNALACTQEYPLLITVMRQQELHQNNMLFDPIIHEKLTLLANSEAFHQLAK